MEIGRNALLVVVPSLLLQVLLAGDALGASKPLPSFIKPCARNDPNLNKCATANAVLVVPKMKNGIPGYGVSSLDPLYIQEIKFDRATLGLDMLVKDVQIHGLGDSIVKNIEMELDPPYFRWHLIAPRVQLLGSYEADGRILFLPIQGKGPINITLDNVDYIFSFKSSIVKKSDGQEYLVPKPSTIDHQNGRTYFKLENLFSGNKLLGDELNRFLNENWKEVLDLLGPSITKSIATAIQKMVENLTRRVPFDRIFPEKV